MSTKKKQSADYGKSLVAFKDRRNIKHFSLWRNVDNKVQISGKVINLVKDVFSSVNDTSPKLDGNNIFRTYISNIYDVDSNSLISYNGNGKGLKIQFSIMPNDGNFQLENAHVMIHISEHGYGYKEGEIITCQKGIFLNSSATGDSSTLKISSVF